ncbi:hypothetical protein DSO57_1032844 [Entomophthora muscae]|uniref:Uncharacterized protein n=1 Tax=Entomophthora muscae TaxID=34485 RepID=A0ACC2RRE9_9FUNG|nr:hypothetical protein DSO57_1032844 [Entomophthora muscae]
MSHVLETGYFPRPETVGLISLLKKDKEAGFLEDESGLTLLYTNESALVKEILRFLQFGYFSRNQAQGGILYLATSRQLQDGEACLFSEIDVMLRSDLALTHATPQSLRRIISEFAPYIAMAAYFDSWIDAYLSKQDISTIFQRFLYEVNQLLLGVRAFFTALELALAGGATITLLELSRKCRLHFDTLAKIYVAFSPDCIQGLVSNQLNASLAAVVLEQLHAQLDRCWQMGDDHGYHIYLILFKPCFEIYMHFMSDWIRFGCFQDFRNEFMIEERDGKFHIRKENPTPKFQPFKPIPGFICALAEDIFATGILLRELQSLQIHSSHTQSPRGDSLEAIANFFVPFAPLPKRRRSPTFYLVDSQEYPISENNFDPPPFPDLPEMPPPRREAKLRMATDIQEGLEKVVLTHLPHNSCSPDILPGSTHLLRGRSRFGFSGTIPHLVSFNQAFDMSLCDFIQERHVEYNLQLLNHLRKESGLMSYLISLQAVFLFQHVPHIHIFTKELSQFQPREPISQFHIDVLLTKAFYLQPLQFPCLTDTGLDPSQAYTLRRDDFSMILSDDPIYPVQVEFALPWPLDNVVDPVTFLSYQKLFQLIYRLQRARYALEKTGCWRADASRPISHLWIGARMQLFNILNSIYFYIMTTIIHTSAAQFNREAESVRTVHELKTKHTAFVRDIFLQCFLDDSCSAFLDAVFAIADIVSELNAPDSSSLRPDILTRISSQRNFLASTLSVLARSTIFSRLQALSSALES